MALTRVWTPSPNHSGGSTKRLMVAHSMEGFTGPNGAYDCARYFQGNVGASSQVCIDNNRGKVWECVSRSRGSWTQCQYNSVSVSAELSGYAAWSRDYWLGQREPELRNLADWLAEESKALGIPLVKLTPSQAQGTGRGVCYHSDLGSAGCAHGDPGPGFPIDVVLEWAKGGTQPAPQPPTPKPPEEEGDDMGMIQPGERFHSIAFANGRYNWISFFSDAGVEGKGEQVLRVVCWRSDNGGEYWPYGEVRVGKDARQQKATYDLDPAHCAGVSIQRQGDPATWATVSYNLGKG